jgi:hypothetical protein
MGAQRGTWNTSGPVAIGFPVAFIYLSWVVGNQLSQIFHRIIHTHIYIYIIPIYHIDPYRLQQISSSKRWSQPWMPNLCTAWGKSPAFCRWWVLWGQVFYPKNIWIRMAKTSLHGSSQFCPQLSGPFQYDVFFSIAGSCRCNSRCAARGVHALAVPKVGADASHQSDVFCLDLCSCRTGKSCEHTSGLGVWMWHDYQWLWMRCCKPRCLIVFS